MIITLDTSKLDRDELAALAAFFEERYHRCMSLAAAVPDQMSAHRLEEQADRELARARDCRERIEKKDAEWLTLRQRIDARREKEAVTASLIEALEAELQTDKLRGVHPDRRAAREKSLAALAAAGSPLRYYRISNPVTAAFRVVLARSAEEAAGLAPAYWADDLETPDPISGEIRKVSVSAV